MRATTGRCAIWWRHAAELFSNTLAKLSSSVFALVLSMARTSPCSHTFTNITICHSNNFYFLRWVIKNLKRVICSYSGFISLFFFCLIFTHNNNNNNNNKLYLHKCLFSYISLSTHRKRDLFSSILGQVICPCLLCFVTLGSHCFLICPTVGLLQKVLLDDIS